MMKRVRISEGGSIVCEHFTLRVFHIFNPNMREDLMLQMANDLECMVLFNGFELDDVYVWRFIRNHDTQSAGIVTGQPLMNFLPAIEKRITQLGYNKLAVKVTTHSLNSECCDDCAIMEALLSPYSEHTRLYLSNDVELDINLN